MAKTVFTLSEIGHVWAHQSQASGRTATRQSRDSYDTVNSVFFEGTTIYSYGKHYPMAQYVGVWKRKNYPEQRIYLMNSEDSTVTTQQHMSMVRRAIGYNGGVKVFTVPSLGGNPLELSEILFNLEHYQEQFKAAWDKGIKGLKRLRLKNIERALEIHGVSDDYADCMVALTKGLSKQINKHRINVPMDDEELKTYLKQCEVWQTEGDAKLAESQAKARATLQATRQREYEERQARWEEQRKQREADAALRAETLPTRVQAWRDNQATSNVLNYQEHQQVGTMLRIEGDNVRTSRDAVFPITHAYKAWLALQEIMANAPECQYEGVPSDFVIWQRNGKSIKLGVYQIDKILKDGTVYAGCHIVKYDEILQLAPALIEAVTRKHQAEVSGNE